MLPMMVPVSVTSGISDGGGGGAACVVVILYTDGYVELQGVWRHGSLKFELI